ncbi:transcription repressor NadR [Lachnospiraceae bacterium OttesenSCG-928-E19]|nr:transcription repressor NadR [Lachnospiraceae bacterium OttesenSCG-928-E19]
MNGEERRKLIIERLINDVEPLAGAALAKEMGVSRQVIVQDIALLRATNKNILSTNKGYVYYKTSEKKRWTKVVAVKHSDADIEDELNTIVDLGGRVLDVIVEHDVYGQIAVDLRIETRRDVKEFVKRMSGIHIRSLKELTSDFHYHTIDAVTEDILSEIEKMLKLKGYCQ